jgi:hypothetical protein
LTDDVHIQFLRLLLATIDDDEVVAHAVINGADLVALSHYLAHRFVKLFDDEREQFRDDVVHDLAVELDGQP